LRQEDDTFPVLPVTGEVAQQVRYSVDPRLYQLCDGPGAGPPDAAHRFGKFP
jgi:hypothetical protein